MKRPTRRPKLTDEQLRTHDCGDMGWASFDSKGIYLTRVCSLCITVKHRQFRDVIHTGYSQADVDETIEPEAPIGRPASAGWDGFTYDE